MFNFQVEYAKSGRASCRQCKDTIGKDSLRVARLVKSPHFDGTMPQWYHFRCIWKAKRYPSDENDIKGMDAIKYEDQEKITAKIAKAGPSDGGSGGGGEGSFLLEYAKSSRSKCKSCGENILNK